MTDPFWSDPMWREVLQVDVSATIYGVVYGLNWQEANKGRFTYEAWMWTSQSVPTAWRDEKIQELEHRIKAKPGEGFKTKIGQRRFLNADRPPIAPKLEATQIQRVPKGSSLSRLAHLQAKQ